MTHLEGTNDGKVGHADHLVVAITLDDGELAEHLAVVAEDLLHLQSIACEPRFNNV